MIPPAILLKSATIRHNDDTTIIFPDLMLEVGAEAALVGPSGSGKSSLLHVLSGLMRPSQGTVLVMGEDLAQISPTALERLRAGTVSLLFQDFHLLAGYSALENVVAALGLAGQSLAAAPRAAKALLERVGLGHRLTAMPDKLSTGERQRLALARALANTPKILLADEPTAHLDGENARNALNLLRQLAQDISATLVIATHDPLVVAQLPQTIEMGHPTIGNTGNTTTTKIEKTGASQ
jgi:ABC-type lipoprotein export system ATPase subunit